MQESNLVFNIQSAYELYNEPQPSNKLINYSSSSKILSKSSTQVLNPSSAKIFSSAQFDEGLKKCVRRGDKVYKVKQENINMFERKGPRRDSNGNGKKTSLEAPLVDKVQSGESLYKTFSFQQSSSNDDTEKCIAFWRSVMEKNLAPIKCSIIEQGQSSHPSEVEEPVAESEGSLRSEIAKLHDDYKKMVQSVLQDLQKKRLHEIKMYGARCRLCESLSSSVGVDSDKISSIDVEDVVAELDEWVPQSKKKQMSKTKLRQRPEDTDETSPEKTDADPYRHIDVIDEKTKSGAYTAWRRNKVEEPCPCGNLNCDCNINPAIVSIEVPTPEDGDQLLGGHKTKSGTKKHLDEHSRSTSSEKESLTSSDLGSSEATIEDDHRMKGNVEFLGHCVENIKQSLSFVVNCECGVPNCTCQSKLVNVSRTKVKETESHRVVTPTAVSNITVASSFEISRETIIETPRTITARVMEIKDEIEIVEGSADPSGMEITNLTMCNTCEANRSEGECD